MEKILVKDFFNVITRNLLMIDNFYHIRITDFLCHNEELQICFCKEDDFEMCVISDLTAEDKFMELYDKLVATYTGRTQLVTGHSFCGKYLVKLIIDGKVIISFEYRTHDGHRWLYEQWCKN